MSGVVPTGMGYSGSKISKEDELDSIEMTCARSPPSSTHSGEEGSSGRIKASSHPPKRTLPRARERRQFCSRPWEGWSDEDERPMKPAAGVEDAVDDGCEAMMMRWTRGGSGRVRSQRSNLSCSMTATARRGQSQTLTILQGGHRVQAEQGQD